MDIGHLIATYGPFAGLLGVRDGVKYVAKKYEQAQANKRKTKEEHAQVRIAEIESGDERLTQHLRRIEVLEAHLEQYRMDNTALVQKIADMQSKQGIYEMQLATYISRAELADKRADIAERRAEMAEKRNEALFVELNAIRDHLR